MAKQPNSAEEVDSFIAQTDTGARNPDGWQGRFIIGIAFVWALFQLYISSTLPFTLQQTTGLPLVINNTDARFIHLAFALFLAAVAFPLFRSSSRNTIPWYDWILGIVGIGCCLYLVVFKDDIAVRAGLPTTGDLVAASVGLTVLGIAVFRSLGLPLVIVAGLFLAYCFLGGEEWMPDAIRWKGASFNKAMWHYWMQTEGVFGVALGVSASMIFLFVMFGSILDKAGAGNYFIKIAFALLGHFRGGPAKAAVVASALSGIYSGSSIANTVTTGTFTIPLMKRSGFSPEKAGAVEVASSTNGQLMPPVMGAAAFLIAEYTGSSYTDIVKHAFLPAMVSYIALVYIVHLEALKLNLKGFQKYPSTRTVAQKLLGFVTGFLAMCIIAAAVYYGLGWIKTAMPEAAFTIVAVASALIYVWLAWVASREPDLQVDDPNAPVFELPRAGPTAVTGLYFLLPIVILIWCIMIERLSPSLSAFWATVVMVIIAVTQHPLKAAFRSSGQLGIEFKRGVHECFDGMVSGARNMIGIAVATGAAGIIVGTISLTGAHQIVGEVVEFLSGGSLMLMLVLVAVMSLILGMGLPTTANYIVVSSLMAPVIVALGAKNGLIVPLVAVHMFVFYFGILADDTPPVGLAAFAASAISQGDPIKTGIQGFAYDVRTALLPFLFIFNTELLLIDVTVGKAIFIFLIAVIAMMIFAAATQGYWIVRSKPWEIMALLLAAFTLFRPGYWLDQVVPPYDAQPGSNVLLFAASQPEGAVIRLRIEGPDYDDPDKTDTSELQVDLGKAGTGIERLERSGLLVLMENGVAKLDEPLPATEFSPLATEYDFYADVPVKVTELLFVKDRLAKEIFYIPAFAMIALVYWMQMRRRPV